ncbi:probable cationic amino acid transporter isoform X1 [Scylla paramamosain]|uniref:probable cationic amino acid transporter isoform X1 n=2 Tax=Scylla paramamosain TaxID=85552 RepID=UPI0030828064
MTPPLLHPRRPHSLAASARHIYAALVRTRPLAPQTRPQQTHASGIWGGGGRGVGMLVYRSVGMWAALGVGYLVGIVAGPIAGAAVTSSLLVAAVTSLLTGFCYTELVTSADQCSGQVYTVTYQLVGEAAAYLVGLFYMLINASALAALTKALSSTMDYLCGGKVERWVGTNLGHLPVTHEAPDFIAAGACLSVAVILALGLEQAGFLRAVMSGVTFLCLIFFFIVGGTHTEKDPAHLQTAFTSLGSSELLAGAAVCMVVYGSFYEAGRLVKSQRRVHRVLPLVVSVSTGTSFLAFFVLGIILTLMTGNVIPPEGAPLIQAMERRDVSWARLVLGCFQVVMLCLSLVEAATPLSRQLVSLASDGLLPPFLAVQCPRTSAHVHAHLTGGSLAAILALTLNHVLLLQVLATCMLVVHVVVVVTVLYRRHRCSYAGLCCVAVTPSSRAPLGYLHLAPRSSRQERTFHFLKDGLRVLPKQLGPRQQEGQQEEPGEADTHDTALLLANEYDSSESPVPKEEEEEEEEETKEEEEEEEEEEEDVEAAVREYREKVQVATLDRRNTEMPPTPDSARRALLLVSAVLASLTAAALMAIYTSTRQWAAVGMGVCLLVAVISVGVLSRQPAHPPTRAAFRVPAPPWLPAAALLLNVTLLMQVLGHTWPLMAMVGPAGIAWYLLYGMRHSQLGSPGGVGVGVTRGPGGETIRLQPLTPPPLTPTPLQAPQRPSILPHPHRPHQNYARLTQVDTVLISR